ncbi:MAG: chromate resistance protein [Desulfobulbaceae bacterium]|nr:chromate resistance protein [Desulfobulbaceae bacterium]
MTTIDPKKWLLLIHQIPPNPNALRVKIWRRLQQVGAVAIKQSVYAMPFSEQSREDLSWILKEIVEGGGDGSISEARFVEGLTGERVVALFQIARKSDYEKIIQDANLLLSDWSSRKNDPKDPAVKGPAQVSRLQRRLDEVAAIDFFQATERGTAEILIKNLAARLSGQASTATTVKDGLDNLKGKTWVTRKNLFVDRIACGWLIRRFVDSTAIFKFVDAASYAPAPDELRFDMFDGEYTHEGDRCTFEVMIQRFQLQGQALVSLAEVIHDIDLKDTKYDRAETYGFNALLTGLVASQPNDDQRMTEGFRLFENLYAYFQRHKGD